MIGRLPVISRNLVVKQPITCLIVGLRGNETPSAPRISARRRQAAENFCRPSAMQCRRRPRFVGRTGAPDFRTGDGRHRAPVSKVVRRARARPATGDPRPTPVNSTPRRRRSGSPAPIEVVQRRTERLASSAPAAWLSDQPAAAVLPRATAGRAPCSGKPHGLHPVGVLPAVGRSTRKRPIFQVICARAFAVHQRLIASLNTRSCTNSSWPSPGGSTSPGRRSFDARSPPSRPAGRRRRDEDGQDTYARPNAIKAMGLVRQAGKGLSPTDEQIQGLWPEVEGGVLFPWVGGGTPRPLQPGGPPKPGLGPGGGPWGTPKANPQRQTETGEPPGASLYASIALRG